MQPEFESTSPELMLAFYRRLYPFKSLFQWLNQGQAPSKLFSNREFAFTLPGDVYLRYHSFDTMDDLKKQIVKLNPSRFEIGAIYSAKPRDKKTVRPTAFVPQQRELVFDIDMTDYDSVRTCCSGKGICKRCWGFISSAVIVLDTALRDQFGFKHLLWVYSGRRGIHCWVSDQEAMTLTDEQRKAIMGWLEVVKGGKEMHKKVNVRMPASRSLHPALEGAVGRVSGVFSELVLEDQECFQHEDGWRTLLELIPDKAVQSTLREQWEEDPERSSSKKWEDCRRQLKKVEQSGGKQAALLRAALEDVILQYLYPRLDAEVSKHRNHLLKAPFCVHPGTGRICVPVDPQHVKEFNPETVPTLGQLLEELNDPTLIEGEHHSDWQKTSLRPYVEMFDQYINKLMSEARANNKVSRAGPKLEF
ncbi:DNA primase catalytic subunit [Sistotremastrum suecicum HHB10207 ss-3]|uniref:DNA primase n=1 Tax=Sistotremastrum suecicum HHB10207 ss-3 TaxID=1314776 RepID=A0A166HTD4_9AGAM|nr:DNA primase catalytic subunit [Sistotremastrum suecicum HHB10207 ss-3]